MLRRPPTTLSITPEDLAAYEDRRANEALLAAQQARASEAAAAAAQTQAQAQAQAQTQTQTQAMEGVQESQRQAARRAREERLGMGRRGR